MLRTFFTILLVLSTPALASPYWNWNDDFSRDEKLHLTQWITQAELGIKRLFGSLPYSYRVHFHRMNDGRGPVPWAHTDKRNGRTVHFHVNTAYSWKTFGKDWTAPHELSHLMFPYLGQKGMWFAEGIASYLQYQIMYANHTITWEQGVNKLKERFQAAENYKSYDDMSIVNLSKIIYSTGAFVRLYWGGAAYFLNVDKRLYDEKGIRLNDVLTDYINCCVFQSHRNAMHMMQTFDRLSKSSIFTELYEHTVMRQGFPETTTALAWLQLHPPELKFSNKIEVRD